MRVCVAIDPGVVTVGYAVFKAGEFMPGRHCPRPILTGAHNLAVARRRNSPPERNSLKMLELVERALRAYRVEQVWVERMEFRSNAQGIAAVNDVLDVQFACGAYAHFAGSIGAAYHPAPVSQWKGQLSKEQVVARVLKKWAGEDAVEALQGLSDPAHPSHDWDAVGIGLWGAGWFE